MKEMLFLNIWILYDLVVEIKYNYMKLLVI